MFFISPLLALFSRDFYRRMARAGLGVGFGYWFYLGTLLALITGATLTVRALPEMDRFLIWLKREMPVLVWHPEGLSIKDKTAFSLVHPKYGPLAKFDMTKTDVTAEGMGEFGIFVTSQKIYLKQPGSRGLRIYDLIKARAERQGRAGAANQPSSFEIQPDQIVTGYRQFKPWLITVFCGILWGAFLLWKLLAALFYSWIGLLVNMGRRDKLDYSHILTLTFFAMTPAIVIQLLQFLIPPFARIPFGLGGSLLVTVFYLFYAIKGTEPSEPPSTLEAVS